MERRPASNASIMEPLRTSAAYSGPVTSDGSDNEHESRWADESGPAETDGDNDAGQQNGSSEQPKRQRKKINPWHVRRKERKEREKKDRLLYCGQAFNCSAEGWRRACTAPDCGRCCAPCQTQCGVLPLAALESIGLVRCQPQEPRPLGRTLKAQKQRSRLPIACAMGARGLPLTAGFRASRNVGKLTRRPAGVKLAAEANDCPCTQGPHVKKLVDDTSGAAAAVADAAGDAAADARTQALLAARSAQEVAEARGPPCKRPSGTCPRHLLPMGLTCPPASLHSGRRPTWLRLQRRRRGCGWPPSRLQHRNLVSCAQSHE